MIRRKQTILVRKWKKEIKQDEHKEKENDTCAFEIADPGSMHDVCHL